jgi:hypothetical protein
LSTTSANLTCACTNADFQFKSSSCLQAECLASELGAAVGLQQAQCGARACRLLSLLFLSRFHILEWWALFALAHASLASLLLDLPFRFIDPPSLLIKSSPYSDLSIPHTSLVWILIPF